MSKKTTIVCLVLLLIVTVMPMDSNAACTLQVDPRNNGWCAGEVDEEGNIIDYFCQEEEAVTDQQGNPVPKHCYIPPS